MRPWSALRAAALGLIWRGSRSHRIGGIDIRLDSSALPEEPKILTRMREALDALQEHQSRVLDRARRDLRGVLVIAGVPAPAAYVPFLNVCALDPKWICSAAEIELVAGALIHEATHARLWLSGIRYGSKVRGRVERACMRAECEFLASRQEDVLGFREALRKVIARMPDSDWSDEALRKRNFEHYRAAGVPGWLAKALSYLDVAA